MTAVKFARKKGNIALASRLLSQCSDGTQEEKQQDELSEAFRHLTLEGTLGEKWGPELQIEKAKVLRAAGEKQHSFRYHIGGHVSLVDQLLQPALFVLCFGDVVQTTIFSVP